MWHMYNRIVYMMYPVRDDKNKDVQALSHACLSNIKHNICVHENLYLKCKIRPFDTPLQRVEILIPFM